MVAANGEYTVDFQNTETRSGRLHSVTARQNAQTSTAAIRARPRRTATARTAATPAIIVDTTALTIVDSRIRSASVGEVAAPPAGRCGESAGTRRVQLRRCCSSWPGHGPDGRATSKLSVAVNPCF